VLRAGRPTRRENETGQNHRQAASMTMAARTTAARVTQPSLTQVAAARASTLAASGCRAAIRKIQASSLTTLAARMMPNGVR
jgi:hypothetical protein